MKNLFTSFFATLTMFALCASAVGAYGALVIYTPPYVSLSVTFAVSFGFVWAGMYKRAKRDNPEKRDY